MRFDFRRQADGKLDWWRIAFLVAALAYAVPIASESYERLLHVSYEARERLIHAHRLWELQPGFRGKPEAWARMASRLLTDRQLLRRVAAKYGGQSQEIETEYRRDLTIARAEIVLAAAALWGAPLALVYALVWGLRRRRARPPPVKVRPASLDDPRYRPPDRG